MNDETQRAQELLKSGEELLERTRNRPPRDWLEDHMDQKTIVVPARKTSPQPREDALMDERLKSLATEIARNELMRCAPLIAEALKPRLKAQKDRIKALEHEVALLKQRLGAIKQEWPLRTFADTLTDRLTSQ